MQAYHTGGERLGEVGGSIVAEVLLGLIDGDPLSYWNVEPDWRPDPPRRPFGLIHDG